MTHTQRAKQAKAIHFYNVTDYYFPSARLEIFPKYYDLAFTVGLEDETQQVHTRAEIAAILWEARHELEITRVHS